MIDLQLVPHPDFASVAVRAVGVVVTRTGGALSLTYTVTGELDRVRWPDQPGVERTDNLWQHTCFEAFIEVAGQPGYSELNLSPAGQWAAYAFDGHRAGMRDLVGAAEPLARLKEAPDRTDRDGRWTFETINAFDPGAPLRLGLTAVIEAEDGSKSYWALAHAPGPPDFHNCDTFVARLPA